MNITSENIKAAIAKLGYKWFADRPNIVGIRTNDKTPDVFNDYLALIYCNKDGKEFMKLYPITTEPGVYYQKKLLNTAGCAVMQPGQYADAYSLGFHQNKADHRALVETGKIIVLRDKDLDGIAGNAGTKDAGCFGCNIHGSQKIGITKNVGPWSAGCQVFNSWANKEELIAVCDAYRDAVKNRFTYTLICENDLSI